MYKLDSWESLQKCNVSAPDSLDQYVLFINWKMLIKLHNMEIMGIIQWWRKCQTLVYRLTKVFHLLLHKHSKSLSNINNSLFFFFPIAIPPSNASDLHADNNHFKAIIMTTGNRPRGFIRDFSRAQLQLHFPFFGLVGWPTGEY